MSAQIKAQVLYEPKDLRLIDRPIEPPAANEVQIAMRATTLCGSDLHYYTHFKNGDIQIREPLSQGHECAGEIVAVGPGVDGWSVGDRVAVEAGVPCDACEVCRDGDYNVCEKMRFRSSATAFPHFQGTLQERFNHPAKWIHRLPDSLSFAEGALLEPLAVAIHAVRKAAAKPGSSCLILGAGAVGLLCAAAAKNSEYGRVVMADISTDRLDFAAKNGFADEIVLLSSKRATSTEEGLAMAKEIAEKLTQKNSGNRFTRTFECTGVESCVRTAIYATRGGGKVLLVGMGTPIQTLPVAAAALREVDLVGVWRYANCYPEGMKIMEAAGKTSSIPDLKSLVTHSFKGLDQVPTAFSMAARTSDDDGSPVIKVVVEN
ncbi:L-iditol 2-dehydrogenase [Colletotrichum karsti]|uniref:L-arabinitol 4-dehydrogenase n=1 Tax=Colletotrichum karsti TaxID=1095194 RepID=A0A9P6I3P8_9PEZI|nr:L-iditol 2-dehydrogenase [Colletotrichum karsti]KAF9875674.1 L-iditol 2-dehydrogenase [Colletotrichum karsti]